MGKRISAMSVSDPLGNAETPPQIEKERCSELVVKLKAGDKSVTNELILGHLRLAIYIAGIYSRLSPKRKRDLLCEAYLALVEATNKADKDWHVNVEYTRYIAFTIHRACVNYYYADRLIRIPQTTRCLHKIKDKKILTEQELPNRINVSPLSVMILNEKLNESITTERERIVIDLKKQGYTQREVGEILGLDQTSISKTISHVEKRFFKGETND